MSWPKDCQEIINKPREKPAGKNCYGMGTLIIGATAAGAGLIEPYAGSQRWYAHTDPHGLPHRSTQELGLQPEPANAYPGWWHPGPSHKMKGVLLH